ncbi:MAG: DUF3786 domain-containing protein [Bilifractor porci]|jgi:hypothetical protein
MERAESPKIQEQKLCEYYISEYQKADPFRIANRVGVPYHYTEQEFQMSVMGRAYAVKFPEFSIRCLEGEDIYDLSESRKFRVLLLRFLLYGTVFEANGDFRLFRELPSGDRLSRQFEEQCVKKMENRYGRVLQVFEAIMEKMNAVRIYGADIAYEMEFLEGLYIRFLFLAGSESLLPNLRILFSSNFPAAFSAEELSDIIEICMDAFDAAEPLLAVANPYSR